MTTVTAPAADLRPADRALSAGDLGGSWPTKYSFAQSLIRHAARSGWLVTVVRKDLDPEGRGTVAFRVDADGHVLHFIAFSRVITERQRTDRAIAETWDVTAALVDGPLTTGLEEDLRAAVPHQEDGRFDARTVIITRANRSARFFDHVASRLADGLQPSAGSIGPSPYLLRSTAYYGNGKFGLKEFGAFAPEHPLAVPYRSQMLSAWLLRETSIILVQHVADAAAAARGGHAASLDTRWARYLGIGNATGLGMVPFVVNHPEILDAWTAMREEPLARVLGGGVPVGESDLDVVAGLLHRAEEHFAQKQDLKTAPFTSTAELAGYLSVIRRAFADSRRAGVHPPGRLLQDLYDHARRLGPEVRGVIASVLTELDPTDLPEPPLTVTAAPEFDPAMTCGQLLSLADGSFAWVHDYDFHTPQSTAYYWFSSQNNEEPRRSRRDGGLEHGVEHSTDIARRIASAVPDLRRAPAAQSLAEFLIHHPHHRFAATRMQETACLRYGEVQVSLVDEAFLPLNVQRFQLACYGMTNYSPQSTDWLRVTLFSGAPRPAELGSIPAHDNFLFPIEPQEDRQ